MANLDRAHRVLVDFVGDRLIEEQKRLTAWQPRGLADHWKHWNCQRTMQNRWKALHRLAETGQGERPVVFLAQQYQEHPDFPVDFTNNRARQQL